MSNDGPKAWTELEKTEHEIENEKREWDRLGLSSDNFQTDLLQLSCQVMALERIMYAKGLCTEEEAFLEFKRVVLEQMTKIRVDIEPQIIEWKKNMEAEAAKAALVTPPSGIIIPGQRP